MIKIESYKARGVVRWRADVAFTNEEGTFKRSRRQGFASEKEARSWARRAELRIHEDLPPEPAPPRERTKRDCTAAADPREWTFAQVFERLEVYWQSRLAPSTAASYSSRYKTHLQRFGSLVFSRMPQDVLTAIAESMAAPIFASVLKHASRIGAVPPVGIWDPPALSNSGKIEFLEPDEIRRLLIALPEPHRSLTLFLAATGCRLGEALGLQRGDLDFGRRLISIERQLCYATHKLRAPKAKRGRTIPMSASLVELLSKLPKGRPDELIFKISRTGYRDALLAAGSKAGIKKRLHPHLLRHTNASLAVQAGIALEVVGEILGHSSVAVTHKYAHLRPEHLAAGIAAVDAAIGI